MRIIGNFDDLEKDIIEKGLCTHCGACVSACPDYNIEWAIDDRPRRDQAKGMCENCTECYDSCYRVHGHFIYDQIEQLVFNRTREKNEPFGIYKKILAARAKDPEILKRSQDGGIASAIGLYLLDKDLVDGVITTGNDDSNHHWKPTSSVATNRDELLKSAGTKYYIAPILKMLKDAIIDMELDRVAIIGLPCQIRSSRFLQKRETDLSFAILYHIGLFCTHNYEYKTLSEAIENHKIRIKDVEKFAIKNGNFCAYFNGSNMTFSLKEMKSWVPNFCQYCNDYSAEFADISIGSQASDEKWSTVIIRSEKGNQLFSELNNEDYIETREIVDYSTITKNSNKKKKIALNY